MRFGLARADAQASELGRGDRIVGRFANPQPARGFLGSVRLLRADVRQVGEHLRITHALGDSHRPTRVSKSCSSSSTVDSTRPAASYARWYLVSDTISSSSDTPLTDSRMA